MAVRLSPPAGCADEALRAALLEALQPLSALPPMAVRYRRRRNGLCCILGRVILQSGAACRFRADAVLRDGRWQLPRIELLRPASDYPRRRVFLWMSCAALALLLCLWCAAWLCTA